MEEEFVALNANQPAYCSESLRFRCRVSRRPIDCASEELGICSLRGEKAGTGKYGYRAEPQFTRSSRRFGRLETM